MKTTKTYWVDFQHNGIARITEYEPDNCGSIMHQSTDVNELSRKVTRFNDLVKRSKEYQLQFGDL